MGKNHRQKKKDKYAYRLEKARIKAEVKEHKSDNKLTGKEAQDQADMVAYQNHMNPANRTAGIISAAGSAAGQIGGAITAIEGGGMMKGLGQGQSGGGNSEGGPAAPAGGMGALTSNPMLLLGIGALALVMMIGKKG